MRWKKLQGRCRFSFCSVIRWYYYKYWKRVVMGKNKKLDRSFYQMHADMLAPALLGKLLFRKMDGKVVRVRITETECYMGESDTACHAAKGRTKRTSVLYAVGGTIYVYLCYGIHEMLNVVAGEEDYPEAVLIRGVDDTFGPGRVTKSLGITRALNDRDLCDSEELWIEDDGYTPSYHTAPRVGIGYASKEDQQRLWRFIADE